MVINKNLNLVKNNFIELPNNIEAEQSVIGSILLTNEIFDDVNAQNILAHNLDYGDKIITEIELERKFHNKDLQDNWNGKIFSG